MTRRVLRAMLPWRWHRAAVVFGAIVVVALALVASSAYGYFTTHGSGTGSASPGRSAWRCQRPTPMPSAATTGPCTSASVGCTSITLPTVGLVGSTFDSTPIPITITNTGNVPVTEMQVAVSDTNNNATMEQELGLCLYNSGAAQLNGLLASLKGAPAPCPAPWQLVAPTPIPWTSTRGKVRLMCGGAAGPEA